MWASGKGNLPESPYKMGMSEVICNEACVK